jgi:prolyl oligopeptidase
MRGLLVLAAAAVGLTACVTMTVADEDPNLWLEDIHGDKALAWVKAENDKSLARLEGDKRYATYEAEALKIFTAKDRLSIPSFRAGGVDNVWQDDKHPHGMWRHATLKSFLSGHGDWMNVLDLDELSRKEGKNWFYKGAECLQPDDTLCLVSLSDGGGDAVEIREFDAVKGTFVEGGFRIDRAKQSVDWLDRDTLLVGRALDDSEQTESGYTAVVRELRRGETLADSKVIFRGDRKDTSVGTAVLRDPSGRVDAVLFERRVGFFDVEYYLRTADAARKINIPTSASLEGYVDGQVIFALQKTWDRFETGALVALDLAAVKRDADAALQAATLIVQPSASQTIDGTVVTRNAVVVQLLDNVKGAVDVYRRSKGAWTSRRVSLPKNSALSIRAAEQSGSQLIVTSESFLEPTRMWSVDAESRKVSLIAALPARFNGATHKVQQLWATSKDGTKIPYFLVSPKRVKAKGATPTLLFGYGGFQISKPPAYLPEMGKLWLEHGGAFVTANIRGGGEFGPAWHQSALRENRQRAFDDFAAVAEDLIARKVTSPRHLGIYGRSNGGVLTTVSMTQRPDLFNAVVVESPLIDMLRYNKLSAGASWVAEYGNPDVDDDRAFIAKYSAYQKLTAGTKYPEPYITTNTEDDRVHPGHARKFAARLSQLGAPYLYFENTFGGHSNDADPALNAKRWARHYVYLAQKLMD